MISARITARLSRLESRLGTPSHSAPEVDLFAEVEKRTAEFLTIIKERGRVGFYDYLKSQGMEPDKEWLRSIGINLIVTEQPAAPESQSSELEHDHPTPHRPA